MKLHARYTLTAVALMLGATLAPMSQAAMTEGDASLSVGAGFAVAPAYQGGIPLCGSAGV